LVSGRSRRKSGARTDTAWRQTVVLLERLADATSTGRVPDIDAPDPSTWPPGLRDLGVACRSVYDQVVAVAAESRRFSSASGRG
jgi:hypothetical protein